MAKGVVGAQEAVGVGQRGNVFVEHLLAIDYGAYLKQIELARAVDVDVAGKLYLHGALHVAGSKGLCHLQQLGQGEHVVLKQAAERDYLAAAFVEAVAYDVVVGVVG